MAERGRRHSLGDLTDEELAALSQAGDAEAFALIVVRYRRFAKAKARAYFLMGADADDIEQEGLIGLYKAARDYRSDRQAAFKAFADLCITRQVISAMKSSCRQKHMPLNQYVSISQVRGGEEAAEPSWEGLLEDHQVADPAESVISNERSECVRRSVREALSGLEVDVLHLYVEGRSYEEVGVTLGRSPKCVDNALQRIKRKLHVSLEPEIWEEEPAGLVA